MADDRLRELERTLAQNPFDNDARKKWLVAKARTGGIASVKSYYKIRCEDKWYGSNQYQQGFYDKQGSRFKTETEAMETLLRFVKYAKQRQEPLEETAVEIVCFEVHTIEANAKTINLVDAAKEAALADIRRKKEELEKHQQELIEREKALLSGAVETLQAEVKHLKKKPTKKKAVKKKATRRRSELDW